MTTASVPSWTEPSLTTMQAVLLLATAVLGTTVYTASVMVSAALLPQLQGALLATQDEVSWVMTFNIVASAVMTPASGWLADRFGRRRTLVWCSGLFAASSLMCGASSSLEEMIFWRILQGAAGAPLVPLGQTLLLDGFPQRQHGTATAIYGMANMIGPAIAPMFAGQIAEQLGWRWGFWMVVPVALLSIVLYRLVLPPDGEQRATRLDWTGFLSLSIAIAAAQLVFSRGQRLDWFESSEIVIAAFIAIVAFYVFLLHSTTAANPFVRVKLFKDRNYAVGIVFVTLFGMLNFAPIVLLPPLLQSFANYSDSLVGEIIGWRGVGAAVGFGAAIFMNWIDARVRLAIGAIMQTATGIHLLTIDVNASMLTVSVNCFMQGLSVGLAWVPMTVLAFQTLAPEHRGEGMSMFHLMRTFGSSLFISIAVAEIVRTTSANYARLGEHISHYNRVLELPWAMGGWTVDSAAGMARITSEITRQATVLGYVNAWLLYTIVSATLIPLCLLVGKHRRAA